MISILVASSAVNIELANATFNFIVELTIIKWFASIIRNNPLLIAKLEMNEQFKKEAEALFIMKAIPPYKAELETKVELLINALVC